VTNRHTPDERNDVGTRDPFAPETIDEALGAWLGEEQGQTGDVFIADASEQAQASARLVRSLADAYTLPTEAEGALARARIRVRLTPTATMQFPQEMATMQASATPPAPDRLRTIELDDMPPATSSASGVRRIAMLRGSGRNTGARIAWQTVAAALVVASLVGAFFAVTRLQRGAASPPNRIGAWENASITAAKARGAPLNFDPAQGADYATAVTGAAIYVNGYANGANHLWYSADGGQTYRLFTPDLPPTQLGQTYILATVSGWSGVFASAGMANGPLQPVYYAEPGATRWTTVILPTSAQTRGTSATLTIDPADVWRAIFSTYNSSAANPAQGAHGWLFAQALIKLNDMALLGTPDLGKTWYDLSASLSGRCSQFATNGVFAQHLICLVGTQVWQTQDGGANWTQLVNTQGITPPVYTQVWMSAAAAYSYGQGGVEQSAVYRYDFAARTWRNVGAIPTLAQGGGAAILGVTSGDMPFTDATFQANPTLTQIYVRHGQAATFTAIGKLLSIPVNVAPGFLALPFVFLADGGKGGVAVYVHDNQRMSTMPLYQLQVA